MNSSSPRQDSLTGFDIVSTKWLPGKWQLAMLIAGIVIAFANIFLTLNRFSEMADTEVLFFGIEVGFLIPIIFLHFFFVPVAALLMSVLLSMIPIRNKTYAHKYWSMGVLVALVLHLVLLLATITGN